MQDRLAKRLFDIDLKGFLDIGIFVDLDRVADQTAQVDG